MAMGALAPDVGRLVIQCNTCDRTARWHGEEAARLQGWHSRWMERGPRWLRTWRCSDCLAAVPPVRPSTSAQVALPRYLVELILAGKAALAEEQLELVRPEPLRFGLYLESIQEVVATELRKGGKLHKHWVGYLKRESRRLTLSMRNR